MARAKGSDWWFWITLGVLGTLVWKAQAASKPVVHGDGTIDYIASGGKYYKIVNDTPLEISLDEYNAGTGEGVIYA